VVLAVGWPLVLKEECHDDDVSHVGPDDSIAAAGGVYMHFVGRHSLGLVLVR
jgi:hypothetical protein